jgi:hypothetical protein
MTDSEDVQPVLLSVGRHVDDIDNIETFVQRGSV